MWLAAAPAAVCGAVAWRAAELYDPTLDAASWALDVAVDNLLVVTGGAFDSLQLDPSAAGGATPLALARLSFKRWGESTFVRYPLWEGEAPERLVIEGTAVVVARPRNASVLVSAQLPLPPLAVYLHKGGMVVGHGADRDLVPRLVRRGFVVVSVEYPLAPEHRFPAQLEAAERVVGFLVHASPDTTRRVLGADPTRAAVVGFSAGGNLAAAVAQTAKRSGWVGLRAHLVASGMLRRHPASPRPAASPSRRRSGAAWEREAARFPSLERHAHRATLLLRDLEWFWHAYLGDYGASAPREDCGARCEPFRVVEDGGSGDLSGAVPPAVVLAATHDVLRDENVEYAERLARRGVRARLVTASGTHWGAVVFDEGAVARAVDLLWEAVVQL